MIKYSTGKKGWGNKVDHNNVDMGFGRLRITKYLLIVGDKGQQGPTGSGIDLI